MDDFEIISSDNGDFEVTKCLDTPLDTLSMSRFMWAMEKAYIEKHGKRPFESDKDITKLKNLVTPHQIEVPDYFTRDGKD